MIRRHVVAVRDDPIIPCASSPTPAHVLSEANAVVFNKAYLIEDLLITLFVSWASLQIQTPDRT